MWNTFNRRRAEAGNKLPKSKTSSQEERLPLPLDVIDRIYVDLEGRKELQLLWTLLDYTGARPSEIRQLLRNEILLESDIPHIVIAERKGRSLKTSWSKRKVPLVGQALHTAKNYLSESTESPHVFPSFADDRGMDRLSANLRKRIRKYTDNKRHVPYSLRHNMEDRLRAAEVYPMTVNAILGHALSTGQGASYGGPIGLGQMQIALKKAFADQPFGTITPNELND